jgi:hypothetical protein
MVASNRAWVLLSEIRGVAMKMDIRKVLLPPCILGVVSGLVLGGIAWQNYTLLQQGKPTPQQLRVGELAANGPGDNIHVTLTDFDFGDGYVVERKNGRWNRVWIPAFPDDQAGQVNEIKVLVTTSRVKDEAELERFYQQETVTGIITNSIHWQGSEIRELQRSYPDLDVSSLWVVDAGRAFPSEQEFYVTAACSGGLLLLGLVCGGILAVVLALRRPYHPGRMKKLDISR